MRPRHPRRLSLTRRLMLQARDIAGLGAIGIRRVRDTPGDLDTGHGRLIEEHIGSVRGTTATLTPPVIGVASKLSQIITCITRCDPLGSLRSPLRVSEDLVPGESGLLLSPVLLCSFQLKLNWLKDRQRSFSSVV